MAEIRSVDMEKSEITINLRVSRKEYDLLNQVTTNLVLLPADSGILDNMLTTGKLGNSNRIMMPKKILKKMNITVLDKKVPAKLFRIGGDVFLLIKLKESKLGIPVFEVVKNE